MTSTFHGLETARRGMTTQQSALYTVGHNIANANTPGYTRQRVNFVQTEPYPSAAINRPDMPGQIGTGVETGSVQRMRDGFLDVQYRNESSKLGYWDSRSQALQKMEDIMNEPSDTGLASIMDKFWQSWQDLAVNPSNSGARSVVKEQGILVADSFNYIADSLTAIRNDLKNELDITKKEINSLTSQINDLNRQIAEVEPHGYLPNDLYDERDRLIDQLSSYANIKVTTTPSGGQALDIAEGKVTITMVNDIGEPIGTLVDGKFDIVNELDYTENNGFVNEITLGNPPTTTIEAAKLGEVGEFSSLIRSYGYMDGTEEKGIYPEMIDKIDQMAFEFATELNRVHRAGWNITDINDGTHTPVDFFEDLGNDPAGAASKLKLSSAIEASLDNIAAAGDKDGVVYSGDFKGYAEEINGTPTGKNFTNIRVEINYKGSGSRDNLNSYTFEIFDKSVDPEVSVGNGELANLESETDIIVDLSEISDDFQTDKLEIIANGIGPVTGNLGDGSNALALAEVKNKTLTINNDTTTLQSFYEGIIGEMAVDAQGSERLAFNSAVLRDSVETNRLSVSAVSLDEEMTNMIQFQHAYNAAARMITLTDEILDKVINGMGTGGR
ncbi:flagellar hook-associated protein FlgK [Cytobacillus sp. Hm23]